MSIDYNGVIDKVLSRLDAAQDLISNGDTEKARRIIGASKSILAGMVLMGSDKEDRVLQAIYKRIIDLESKCEVADA